MSTGSNKMTFQVLPGKLFALREALDEKFRAPNFVQENSSGRYGFNRDLLDCEVARYGRILVQYATDIRVTGWHILKANLPYSEEEKYEETPQGQAVLEDLLAARGCPTHDETGKSRAKYMAHALRSGIDVGSEYRARQIHARLGTYVEYTPPAISGDSDMWHIRWSLPLGPDGRISLIKAIRLWTDLGLKGAKDIADRGFIYLEGGRMRAAGFAEYILPHTGPCAIMPHIAPVLPPVPNAFPDANTLAGHLEALAKVLRQMGLPELPKA